MKIIKVFYIIIFINIFLSASEKIDYLYYTNIGISNDAGILSKFKDRNVALNSWVTELAEFEKMKININIYYEKEKILKDYKNKKLDTIILDALTYYRNKDLLDPLTYKKWGVSLSKKKRSRYYLIADGEKKLKGFKDLKNKKLVLKSEDRNANIWLEKNSLTINKKSSKKLLHELKKEKNDRRVVYNVFFGKSDYGIITKKAWDIIVSFNPAIKKKVKIIDMSDEIFFDNLGIYSKSSDATSREFFLTKGATPQELKSEKALRIINLLKIDSLFIIEDESLKDLNKFFKEYFELEKRYN